MGEKNSRGGAAAVRVARYLAAHDGVITAAQAYSLGMSRGGVQRRVGAGLWVPHARSVYLSAEHQMTDTARLRIAIAAHCGTADRSAAAWLHGLVPVLPESITMSIPRSTHGGASCAVETDTKRRDFPAEDVTTVCGISTVSVPLAILQVAAVLDSDGAVQMMDRALQTKRVGLRALRESLDRNSGSHGMRIARIILASAEDESESEAERLFVRLLKRYGVTGWKQQVWICGHRIDFVWPELGVAVSIHGWAFHHQYDRWDNDLRTANAVAGMGILPLSYPWHRLRFEEEAVMAELIAALEARQAVQ